MTQAPTTILLAEDNPTTVEVVVKLLTTAGYRCIQARGGAAAYRTFCEQQPNVVVTDLNMAGGDGYVLIDRIREISSVPVLVITGTNASYARQRVEEFDGVSILPKPFEKDELLAAIQRLLAYGGERRPHLHEIVN